VDLVIRGKNIDVPETAREYIAKRVEKFDRHLRNISEATVEVSEEKTRSKDNRYIVEVTLDVQGTFIRGEERRADILSAFDAVADVITRQMRRFKDRSQGKKRRASAAKNGLEIVEVQADEMEEPEEEGGVLIRTKRFPVRPMSPEEATEQMELLGHDFFVFFNSYTERIGVVYRRRDGDYGLIDPELD